MYYDLTDFVASVADNFLAIIAGVVALVVVFGLLVFVGLPKTRKRRARRRKRH